jgi:hypothetical protein
MKFLTAKFQINYLVWDPDEWLDSNVDIWLHLEFGQESI